MCIAVRRLVKYGSNLRAQKLLVVRVGHEPAQRNRKRADCGEVLFEAADEEVARGAIVARERGVADEVAAFAAFPGRVRVRGRERGERGQAQPPSDRRMSCTVDRVRRSTQPFRRASGPFRLALPPRGSRP